MKSLSHVLCGCSPMLIPSNSTPPANLPYSFVPLQLPHGWGNGDFGPHQIVGLGLERDGFARAGLVRTITRHKPLKARRCRAWKGSWLAASPLPTATISPGPASSNFTRLCDRGTKHPSLSAMATVTNERSFPSPRISARSALSSSLAGLSASVDHVLRPGLAFASTRRP